VAEKTWRPAPPKARQAKKTSSRTCDTEKARAKAFRLQTSELWTQAQAGAAPATSAAAQHDSQADWITADQGNITGGVWAGSAYRSERWGRSCRAGLKGHIPAGQAGAAADRQAPRAATGPSPPSRSRCGTNVFRGADQTWGAPSCASSDWCGQGQDWDEVNLAYTMRRLVQLRRNQPVSGLNIGRTNGPITRKAHQQSRGSAMASGCGNCNPVGRRRDLLSGRPWSQNHEFVQISRCHKGIPNSAI